MISPFIVSLLLVAAFTLSTLVMISTQRETRWLAVAVMIIVVIMLAPRLGL